MRKMTINDILDEFATGDTSELEDIDYAFRDAIANLKKLKDAVAAEIEFAKSCKNMPKDAEYAIEDYVDDLENVNDYINDLLSDIAFTNNEYQDVSNKAYKQELPIEDDED